MESLCVLLHESHTRKLDTDPQSSKGSHALYTAMQANQREVHYGGIYLTTRTCMVWRQFHAEALITMHNYADTMTMMIFITRLAAVIGLV